MFDTRNNFQIPWTRSAIQPGNYNCDCCNIILLMCEKCDSGNSIWETSNKLRFRLNNHKKSIRDNSSFFSVAVHLNQTDHSHKNLRCIILRGDIKTTANRLIYEQTFIRKLEAHWKCVDQDLSFLSPYRYFHMCWQRLAATSDNYTEVWRQKLSEVFCVCVCVRIYRQYSTVEGHRSVRRLWSFYYRFTGLMCHNYALF